MMKMIKFKSQAITKEQAAHITGGIPRKKYCKQNRKIAKSAYDRGDAHNVVLAGKAYEEHCRPYGY